MYGYISNSKERVFEDLMLETKEKPYQEFFLFQFIRWWCTKMQINQWSPQRFFILYTDFFLF